MYSLVNKIQRFLLIREYNYLFIEKSISYRRINKPSIKSRNLAFDNIEIGFNNEIPLGLFWGVKTLFFRKVLLLHRALAGISLSSWVLWHHLFPNNHLTHLILKCPCLSCRKHILVHNGKGYFMSVFHLQIARKRIYCRKRACFGMNIPEGGVPFIRNFNVPSTPPTGRDLYNI